MRKLAPSRSLAKRAVEKPGLAIVALLLGAFAVATVALPPPAEAQCAMCRSAFDSPEGRRMIRKYQAGVAFLLTVPFAAFGTVAFFAVRGKKKLDSQPER
jgi:hypothetical protein